MKELQKPLRGHYTYKQKDVFTGAIREHVLPCLILAESDSKYRIETRVPINGTKQRDVFKRNVRHEYAARDCSQYWWNN